MRCACSSCASPTGNARGTSTDRTPSPRSTRAATAATGACGRAFSSGAAPDQESTRSTRACFVARSISRSLMTTIRWPRACTNRKGSGAKKRVA